MKVILTDEVLGLGDPGQVVNVKNGYGRNYLIPRGLALQATKNNLAVVEAERKRIAIAQARQAEKIRGEAASLEGVAVTVLARSGEGGKLYGSVTNMDLAKALAEQGHEIDRRRILLEAPIKKLGQFQVKVKLHPQVVIKMAVTVEPTEDSLKVEAPEEVKAAAAQPQAPEAEAAQAEVEEAPEAADKE